jgi:hypothetical protein
MKPKSPEKQRDQVLGGMSTERIKAFLLDSVNLANPIDYPDHVPYFERWLKRWESLFTYSVEAEAGKWIKLPIPPDDLKILAPVLRTTLCRMWSEPDSRQRDWYCYRLRDTHRQMVRNLEGWDVEVYWGSAKTVQRLVDYALQEVPRNSPFEAAIYWAQNNQKLMLRCVNTMCAAPYFFRSEKGQKFCSQDCADSGRKKSKSRWWKESPNSPRNRNKDK